LFFVDVPDGGPGYLQRKNLPVPKTRRSSPSRARRNGPVLHRSAGLLSRRSTPGTANPGVVC
jgi:hypothetical protein